MLNRTFFIQLDALIGDHSLKIGAKEFLLKLLHQQRNFLIFTEQSSKSRKQLLEQFESFGIEGLQIQHFYTTSMAAIDWLRKKAPEINQVAYLGGKGIETAINQANLTINYANANAVIIGMNQYLSMTDFNEILNCIQKAKYFINIDGRKTQMIDGNECIGNASCVKMLENASNKNAMDFTRSSAVSIDMALHYLNVSKKEILFVGVDFKRDILPAHRLALETVLITNGESIMGLGFNQSIHPTYLVEDLFGLCK